MLPRSRRSVLRYAGLGVGVPLAGRLDAGGKAIEAPAGVDHELRQFAASQVEPDWYGEGTAGHVELFDAADEALERLPFDRVSEDRREQLKTFVEDTDFENARLLYVASVGPDACYTAIEVRALSAAGEAFSGTVAAVDGSDDDRGCAEVLTFPSALVRATVDGDPPDRAELVVVDGLGNEETVRATVGSPVEVPCNRDGHVRPDDDPETVPDDLVT